jgi:hypothetical protein
MRRLAALALALLASACSDSPCQELGERLCSCTGLSDDTCKAQVEAQLESVGISDDTCDQFLARCSPPPDGGASLCEWLLTEQGKTECGIALPDPTPVGST